MTNLERLALLGNKEAQKECTEKGILLLCPVCSGEVEIIGVNNSNPFTVWCDNCGLEFGVGKDYHYYQIVESWNTRQAPPIGRCEDCQYQEDCRKQITFDKRDYILEQNVSEFFKLGYCSYFEPRCEE